MGCWTMDAVPGHTFTPQDHLVELLRVVFSENATIALLQPQEKSFLVLMLIRQYEQVLRIHGGCVLFIVALEEQIPLWINFLTRMTNLSVTSYSGSGSIRLAVSNEIDRLQDHNIVLLIVDNCHIYISSSSSSLPLKIQSYKEFKKNVRVVGFTVHLFDESKSLDSVNSQIQLLKEHFGQKVETACDVLTLLRYVARPQENILCYSTQNSISIDCDVEKSIEDFCTPLKSFLENHEYSLEEVYGDEFNDLLQDIPNPSNLPLQLLDQFLGILRTLGLWCAERAALLLTIKIEKLKTREKYERHFLLLGVLYTEMMKVRKICSDAFSSLTEKEKLSSFSKPKLNKLMDILLAFKPHHIGNEDFSSSTSSYNRSYLSYDDPNSLCGVIFVQDKFVANVLYHYVKDSSRYDTRFSFLMPQYAILSSDDDFTESNRKLEDSLRRFRMRESNLLISNSHLEIGIDYVRCNIIIAFDSPLSFQSYANYKVKAKAVKSYFLTLVENSEVSSFLRKLSNYTSLQDKLMSHCKFEDSASVIESKEADANNHLLPVFRPKGFRHHHQNDDDEEEKNNESKSLHLGNSVLLLNRYCAKLPSDSFSRLSPLHIVVPTQNSFVCALQLPLNCPLKIIIIGSLMPSRTLALRATAYKALLSLYNLGEIDDSLAPIGKESLSKKEIFPYKGPRPGTTKRRQYYYKKSADCLVRKEKKSKKETKEMKEENEKEIKEIEEKEESNVYSLYSLVLTLSSPLPDDQNTRGRKIFAPEDSLRSFGLLVHNSFLPPICPFPIFTRSGEVLTELKLLNDSLTLSEKELKDIYSFHYFTFSKVLRLEKTPMKFSPLLCSSSSNILILPLVARSTIDWDFLKVIAFENERKISVVSEEERKDFVFSSQNYEDAVIMPWYRNQDQPQYFYVAEVCYHLNPNSDFPDQGFDSFYKYYQKKYSINIQNMEQPLLDVDHTSYRLNFLTPRYVNRKGVALATSSEETKRNKRENLEQKQILIPELCIIHPFPASLWRQTVGLPCILYRINSLLIAESLRSLVASEIKLGIPRLPSNYVWPPLDFGWMAGESESQISEEKESRKKKKASRSVLTEKERLELMGAEEDILIRRKFERLSVSEKLILKMSEGERELKRTQLEIGTWSNEMATYKDSANAASIYDDDDDEEHDELFDPNIALPENLTILSTDILSSSTSGRDWGMGIQQKHFRVGSPTFFTNPNIHIPGCSQGIKFKDQNHDENDYTSDSSSFSDDDDDEIFSNVMQQSKKDSVRIEFRSDHMAEAFEDENEENRRVESLARDLEEEASMVQNIPWNWNSSDSSASSHSSKDSFLDLSSLVIDHFHRDLGEETEKPIEAEALHKFISYTPKDLDLNEEWENIFQKHLNLDPEFICDDPNFDSYLESETPGIFPLNSKFPHDFSFDFQPDLSNHPGPSPSIILQALTMSNSNDAINLERLETIGDSFLKFAITFSLFQTHPFVHEGRLSHLRSQQVSNLNLYNLGKEKKLGEKMIATKFEPHDNWLPPSYTVPLELEEALIVSGLPENRWNVAEFPSLDSDSMSREEICDLITRKTQEHEFEEMSKFPSFIPYNLLTQQSIPDKSIADSVEALIGAYLISTGQKGALLFMSWLGLSVLSESQDSNFHLVPSPHSLINSSQKRQLSYFLTGYNEFEETIGYKFRNPLFLLQAFTHASYYLNRLTDCYQRLEFLGDAILDYLITRFLYEDPRRHSPGALTDLRSALVNNTIFASLSVKYNFHKYFKHFSPGLQTVIDRFVKIQMANGYKVSDDFFLADDEDAEEAEDIEVPKSLGDIFESVAGAIFLDSGRSLDVVWSVYYRMMSNEIDKFSSNVPKSPIRELLELEPETSKFGKPEKLADGKRVRVTVEVFGKGIFKGIGRNYRIAKCTAAKCALKAIKRTQS